jgi:ubiquinone/menaquinone biosynthesis C-methylase UbiE
VCAGNARAVMTLGAGEIRNRLKEEFAAPVPAALAIADYEMRECGACGLVFADPMRPGDAAFYTWITSFPEYDATSRWEWRTMRRLLEAHGRARILDVGCGDGTFLASMVDLPGVELLGIDLNEPSVERACAKGINARRASLEDLAKEEARFDVVTMTHVLEHVADPLGVVEGAKRLLAPGGEIVVSVPYSPTSREYVRPDIMNLPPHHLTRWNMRALKKLAQRAGLALSYDMRKPKPLWKRATQHATESINGTSEIGGFRRAALLVSHPAAVAEGLRAHRAREKVDGRRAADEILVRLMLPERLAKSPA